ncbi:MAG: Ser-Thr-rich GPI-anchored membrane family protein, partial [Candidatus Hermodarchaeota archaeon]
GLDILQITMQPDSIIVMNPTSSSKWTKGTEYIITWIHNGTFTNVKIELYKSSSLELTLTSSTSNNGSYPWTVNMSLTAGTTYQIKVTSTSDSEVYDYSDYFSIEDAPAIEVTSPTSSSTWTKGTEYIITWTHNGTFTNVKIELYKSSSLELTLTSSTSNNGNYPWTVNTCLTAGTIYQIKVTSTSDSEVYDYSDNFVIEDRPSTTSSTTTFSISSCIPTSTPGFEFVYVMLGLLICVVLLLLYRRRPSSSRHNFKF